MEKKISSCYSENSGEKKNNLAEEYEIFKKGLIKKTLVLTGKSKDFSLEIGT